MSTSVAAAQLGQRMSTSVAACAAFVKLGRSRERRRWNGLYGDGDDPIIINSGFRCPEVNKAVGGWAQSNHLTGCAVDIRCVGNEQAIRYATLLLDISDLNHEDFDELIIERKGYSYWIHFAVRPFGNRRRTNYKR